MWLYVHHPRLGNSQEDNPKTKELRTQVLMTSVEVVEFGALLGRSRNTAKWSWLFKTYLQWHAVAYVLSELCIRPPGPDYERAWNAVDSLYDRRMIEQTKGHKGVLWRPLKQLYARAKKRRADLTGKSPATSSSNASVAPESPAQPAVNGFQQNFNDQLNSNMFNKTVPNATDALELDFNDPGFGSMVSSFGDDFNMLGGMNGFQQQNQSTFQAVDQLPFGFQTSIDFLDDYAVYPSQQNFGQPMPQEWH